MPKRTASCSVAPATLRVGLQMDSSAKENLDGTEKPGFQQGIILGPQLPGCERQAASRAGLVFEKPGRPPAQHSTKMRAPFPSGFLPLKIPGKIITPNQSMGQEFD